MIKETPLSEDHGREDSRASDGEFKHLRPPSLADGEVDGELVQQGRKKLATSAGRQPTASGAEEDIQRLISLVK